MAIETDPVCGMAVDTATSELSFEYHGKTYWFCGKGCLLDFRDDPEQYLAPEHEPTMETGRTMVWPSLSNQVLTARVRRSYRTFRERSV